MSDLTAIVEAVAKGLADGGAANVRLTRLMVRAGEGAYEVEIAAQASRHGEPRVLWIDLPREQMRGELGAGIAQRHAAKAMRGLVKKLERQECRDE